jgi:hypothetical protein
MLFGVSLVPLCNFLLHADVRSHSCGHRHLPNCHLRLFDLLDLLVGGHLPDLPSLSASALITLEQPGGLGVLPIAIGKAWLRLASLCAMAACPDTRPAWCPPYSSASASQEGASAWAMRSAQAFPAAPTT